MDKQDIKKIPTLINASYLKAYSLLPENYDLTEIENFIPIAERIHIEPILGQPLYEELLEQVIENKLTQINSTLLLEVYRVLGVAVVFESLPFIRSHISQVGITLGKSDNSDSISNKDLNVISLKLERQLEYEKRHLKEWIEERSDSYPLYTSEITECGNIQIPQRILYSIPKKDTDIN